MPRPTSLCSTPLRLGLGLALALGGCSDDDGTGESGGSEAGSGTADGTGTSTAAEGTGGTAAATDDAGTSGGSTSSAESTGAGVDPSAACVESCELLLGCELVDVPNCGIPCATIESMVAGCEQEYVAQQQCVAALSCEDATTWSEAMMSGDGHPCAAEDSAYQACISGR